MTDDLLLATLREELAEKSARIEELEARVMELEGKQGGAGKEAEELTPRAAKRKRRSEQQQDRRAGKPRRPKVCHGACGPARHAWRVA